jgi:two-component system LytT family sensor kinase
MTVAEPRIPWRTPTIAFVGWTLLSAVIALQNWLAVTSPYARRAGAEMPDTSFGKLLILELPIWYVWGLLTPLVFWLGRRWPIVGDGWWKRVPLHFVASLLFVALHMVLALGFRRIAMPWSASELPFLEAVSATYRRVFAVFMLVYFGTLASGQAFDYYRAYQARAVAAARLEMLLARNRLAALKAQLEPHFLFNTLHAVSALMETNITAARRMLAALSDLLRMTLEEDKGQEISLDDELRFLGRYMEILQMRFADRLTFEVDADLSTRGAYVPRLILQPLVENAVKHGVSKRAAAGRVRVQARIRSERLVLEVHDDGPGVTPPAVDGVGLANTRQRLSQLYGTAYRFDLTSSPEGGTVARVELPLKFVPAPVFDSQAPL